MKQTTKTWRDHPLMTTIETVEVDYETGRPLSSEFLAARANAHAAARRETMASVDGADPEEVVRLWGEWWSLANEAYAILLADRLRGDAAEVAERNASALAAPFEAAIARAVDTLRTHGPMTAAELEARRLPGLSHNAVRPILREAQARDLADSIRNGRRIEWFAIG